MARAATNSLVWLLRVAAGATIAVPCAAQETITFEVRFSDPVLTPGEVQHVEVWATFAPVYPAHVPWNTNGGTGQLGTVMGFGGADFDVRNLLGAETGTWSALAVNPSIFWWSGVAGQANAGGGVTGVRTHQLPAAPISPASPILLWSADWTPLGYESREVQLATEVMPGPYQGAYIYLDVQFGLFVPDAWELTNIPGSFTVVPGSASAWVFVAAVAIGALGRRRFEGETRHGP